MKQATRNSKMRRLAANGGLPCGAWLMETAIWGERQRVRLVTGPPSLVEDIVHVRSVHAVAFVPDTPDDVLLVENKDGSWTFPGGRLEPRETIADALVREMWEEARAVLAPVWSPVAATQVEFLNRLPGRVYRVHPSFFWWVVGTVARLSDEPCLDPADGVVGRRVLPTAEARPLLGPLEQSVLTAALTATGREI